MVHVENAPAQNPRMTRNFLQHNPLERLPHPPYSPDVSPSDCYLWESKGTLIGQEIPDEIGLLDAVTEILNGISKGELQPVFRSCIERVENRITAEGAYAS
jgi:histone-lysine N-methyltransferase SETMAR